MTKPKETKAAKNLDLITNTSPCLQRKRGKQKKAARNEAKAANEQKSRRNLKYFSEKMPTFQVNSIDDKAQPEKAPQDMVKSMLAPKQSRATNKGASKQIKKITQHFSQELLSNQVKLESMRKLYLKKKSNIDNKLEQMKAEDFFSTNNQILIEYPRPTAKSKRAKLSEEQAPSDRGVRVRDGLRFLKQSTQDAGRSGEPAKGSKGKVAKKRLRIQKFEKKKANVKKVSSKCNLKPKINIYQRVSRR